MWPGKTTSQLEQFMRALELDKKMTIAQDNLEKVEKLLFEQVVDKALDALQIKKVQSLKFQDEEEFTERVNIRLKKESINMRINERKTWATQQNFFKSGKGKENEWGSSNSTNLIKSIYRKGSLQRIMSWRW